LDLQLVDCSLTSSFASGADFHVIYGAQYALSKLQNPPSGRVIPTAQEGSPIGSDWEFEDIPEEGACGARDLDEIMEVDVHGVFLHLALFAPRNEPIIQRVQHCKIFVRSIDIEDRIRSSSAYKLMTTLRHHSDRYAEDYTLKVTWDIISPRLNATLEHRAVLEVAPIRIVIDQVAVQFLERFANGMQQHVQQYGVVQSNPQPIETNQPPLFFQFVKISPLRIIADYHPHRFNHSRLLKGDNIEWANITSVEELNIDLMGVVLRGVNINALTQHLGETYGKELLGYHFALKVACTLGPMRPIANVGKGMADLVLIPLEHYNNNLGLYRGMSKGVLRFSRTLLGEMCNVGVGIGSLAASGVTRVAQTFGYESGTDPYVVLNRGSEPGSLADGLYRARDVVASGIRQAKATMDHARNTGEVREIPLVVLLPVRDLVSAFTQSLIGIRNAVQPHHKRENDRLFKK
jgi:autophagy-related protein 2